MKIPDANLTGITGASSNGASSIDKAASAGGGTAVRRAGVDANSTDAVQLSSFARQINDLQDASPAREARIDQLRSLYQRGLYTADTQALASSLIRDAIA
jgi:flagellar biosynthesis anti-sigma factor FlgM